MDLLKRKATKVSWAWRRAMETHNERQQSSISSKRLLVQVVAYGQIVFAALSMVLVFALILYGISFTLVVAEDPNQALEGDFKNLGPLYRNFTGIVSFLWMGIFLFAVDTFLQLWASTRLLHATETGVTNLEALISIRFWWSYTIISTVTESSPFLYSEYYLVGLFFIAFRFSFLFHVWTFKKTVEKQVKAARRSSFKEAGSTYTIEIFIPLQ